MKTSLLAIGAILTCPCLAQELVAHYDFSEMGGTAFLDTSGYTQDGVWMNSPTLAQPGPAGMAVLLDPTSFHQGDLTSSAELDSLDADCTVAAWVRADGLGGVRRIFGNDGSWAFGASGNWLRFTTRTIRDYDINAALVTGQWYHLAAVFDASFDVTFYLDGAPLGTVTGTAPANSPFPLWHMGALRRDFELWEGLIDDVQVYRGSLDATQILELYQNPGEALINDIGAPYCTANPNSTGSPALLTAIGSDVASQNDVTLMATSLPVDSFVLFITGPTQGFTANPAGSAGNLCLATPLAGYTGPGQVQFTGPNGEASLALDLTQTPTNQGMVPVAPGDTWNFQAWYRDMGPSAPTSNLTDGVTITFQ